MSAHDEDAVSDDEQARKDRSYSPASERETEAKQADSQPTVRDPDIRSGAISVAPGTGGPDDSGDVDVDPGELHLPSDPDSAH
ncbi:MAG TPA: hypothetical protein VNJ54_05825 [Plantibacter sp.]|uniref:hypothetical protein n=1 Tax=unclassified Plantibacter TaxID=2624265 RepID=UPI002CC86DB6|nr:hypothetical protein [Plantibacter sp.]